MISYQGRARILKTKEELGLDISNLIGEIQYLYSFNEEIIENKGTRIDNEFYDVFVLKYDVLLDQITMQKSEVQAVKYMEYPDFKNVVADKNEIFVEHRLAYKLLAVALDDYLCL